ncbi:hypothetical protein [Amycolatopsis sp. BJA-103]|uniref:hypothetical protein n=1 Tax=Amycolatopsis sp. BJA-103 TaxID=1911175 RepID=UPI000C7835E1|nr:hypothetical protein [Amycolatopsis sp. BJA-103]AUI62605.1 hypothetical protein BKN51_33585 [Amycolatopsis sp. BJA-103]PNE18443.1 hypothetical protein B1H26_11270 [Amycolatopsis sp. BJA-103]
MAFHLAHGTVVHRTTTLHGYSAIIMVERFTGGRWQLAAGLPRDAEELTDDAVREMLGEAADEPSPFALPPEDGVASGLNARSAQLDSMIDTTVEWLRRTAVGTDTELAWARYQSSDYDYELDTREALRDAASLLSQMVEQRTMLAARAEMRRRKREDED